MSEQAQFGEQDTDQQRKDRYAEPSHPASMAAYEAMFTAIDDPVFLFDVEREAGDLSFRFRRNNPAHQERTGITTEDARGKTPQELYGEQAGQIVASHFHECVQKQESVEFENTIETAAKTIERQTELVPVVEGGEVRKLLGIVRKTVEKDEEEQELLKVDEQLRVLFEEAPDGIVLHDSMGQIIRVNETLSEMLGYPQDEQETMRISDFEIGIDETTLRERWASMDAGGMQKIEVEGTHKRADGSTYPVEVWVSKVSAEKSLLAGSNLAGPQFIGHVRDISERKQREEELEEQRNNLKILNQMVRHDIRNDLQLVRAYTELLEEHVDEEGNKYLRTVLDSAENAVNLTTTARELAEVMLQPNTECRQVSLGETLETQIEELRSTHPETSVTVEGSLPEADVLGNSMLDSVFRNLLENAVQHNDRETPKITVSADVGDEYTRVRIGDNGPGIPDSQKAEIFGKGEKGLESEGTGIGLYLVKSLVESYGGDVWVEDRAESGVEPSDGAVFVVELPLAE